ncbi:MAG: YdcF family protein [Rhodospirillales bacterium]|nr:YdcF family protein [Rhodospirillales bacterium]
MKPLDRGRRRLYGSVAVLIVLVGAWFIGVLAFVAKIPALAPANAEATDAIVVLTGGFGRLDEGLTLLSHQRGRKLFVSGVYRGVDVQKLLELSQRDPAGLSCCIVLGYAADSTEGNARETATWLKREEYKSIRLVTANYHMPRSLFEFRHAIPGISIIPHPVLPPRFKIEAWWRWPGSASLILAEYHKYIAAVGRQAIDNLTGDW